ncbi:MAG: hypothetical protein KU38_08080 [Sulfurovum sp. FS08-3]|nr:MAG: hypothetical protein KU38_08080 [Sulfurovum sp. FS08-3]
MTIDKSSRYERDIKKLIKSHTLSREAIEATEQLFIKDPLSPSLRYHQIKCKKDKNRYSITVPNTQYRILITVIGSEAYFNTILNHKSYDRINKDC